MKIRCSVYTPFDLSKSCLSQALESRRSQCHPIMARVLRVHLSLTQQPNNMWSIQASFADFIMREFGLTKQKIALTEEAKTLGKDKITTLVDNYFKLVEDNIKALAPFFTSALNRYLAAGYPEDESQDKAFAAIKSLVKDAKNAADMKYPLDAFQAKMANATMSI